MPWEPSLRRSLALWASRPLCWPPRLNLPLRGADIGGIADIVGIAGIVGVGGNTARRQASPVTTIREKSRAPSGRDFLLRSRPRLQSAPCNRLIRQWMSPRLQPASAQRRRYGIAQRSFSYAPHRVRAVVTLISLPFRSLLGVVSGMAFERFRPTSRQD